MSEFYPQSSNGRISGLLEISLKERVIGVDLDFLPDLSLAETVVSTRGDCDGIGVADITRNGSDDVIVGTGTNGDVYWYENDGSGGGWSESAVVTGLGQIEGVYAEDLDGDDKVEVFVADQTGSGIYVCKQDTNDPTGTWSNTQLDNTYANQKLRLFDITGNGDKDLVSAYEGGSAGEGGIRWYEWDGGDPMSANSWTTHQAIQREGAWGIPMRLEDLSRTGEKNEIAYACRGNKNSAYTTGVYYITPHNDPRDTWTETTIDANPGTSNIFYGDLTGDGDDRDLLVCPWSGGNVQDMRTYTGENFEAGTIGRTGELYRSGRPIDYTKATRDEVILTGRTNSQIELWVYVDGQWQMNDNIDLDKADSDILFSDFTDDGTLDLVTPAAIDGKASMFTITQ
jgi:hypothetical protein